ncbi:hypothetical protein GF362_07645 [Candidatus Dojkabacteria bacterium]|nr:hypothetical protein [Candidatus Dojkabacteria bacterium]
MTQNPSSKIISSVIPYKNKKALFSYYIGVFSFIPILGLLLAPLALILGVLGYKEYKQNKNKKGKFHAWFGLIVGLFFFLVHYGLLAWFIYQVILNP